MKETILSQSQTFNSAAGTANQLVGLARHMLSLLRSSTLVAPREPIPRYPVAVDGHAYVGAAVRR